MRQWKMEYQDTRGRLTKVTDANGHSVTYNEYDEANNLTQMTDGGGATSYEYDAANRMKTVNLASGASVTQNWYADGLLQSVNYAAGQTRNYAYDNADRVATITNNNAREASCPNCINHKTSITICKLVKNCGESRNESEIHQSVHRLWIQENLW